MQSGRVTVNREVHEDYRANVAGDGATCRMFRLMVVMLWWTDDVCKQEIT
jgi:hypothetical protein